MNCLSNRARPAIVGACVGLLNETTVSKSQQAFQPMTMRSRRETGDGEHDTVQAMEIVTRWATGCVPGHSLRSMRIRIEASLLASLSSLETMRARTSSEILAARIRNPIHR